jgi:magnesium-transporting ATPase (P-type)
MTDEELTNYRARIECEQPNPSIYTFSGIIFDEENMEKKGNKKDLVDFSKPIKKDNILLRGSRLKNTEYVIGVVVFNGFDTKLMKNAK